MVNGENGVHGVSALKHVVQDQKPGRDLAITQHRDTVEPIAQTVTQTLEIAILSHVQVSTTIARPSIFLFYWKPKLIDRLQKNLIYLINLIFKKLINIMKCQFLINQF